MWVLNGEQAINLEKVSGLRLQAANGEMRLLARLDCGEEVAVASGEPNEMFKLLEALIYNHRVAATAVFDVVRWQANRQRLRRLQDVELATAELEGVRP